MKILYISKHDPFGKSGGGDMASHAYLKAFSLIYPGQIDLCMASHIEADDRDIVCNHIFKVPPRSRCERICSVFNGEMHRYGRFVKNMRISAKDYDLCVFDHSAVGGTFAKKMRLKGIKTITIHHNYEVEYFSDNNRGLYKSLFLPWVRSMERKAYKNSYINLFLTSQDKCKFENVYGKSFSKNAVLGAFGFSNNDQTVVQPLVSDKVTIAITGTLASFQTEDAIKFFFESLYKVVPNDCNIIIAGRDPSNSLISLCKNYPNVELIKNPDKMSEVINQANVYLCPTRLGGGLKLRVMDGLKNGRPVIAHVRSARGFDVFYDTPFFRSFETIEEFKSALDDIICGIKNKSYNPKAIADFFYEEFSLNAGVKRLKAIMNDL